MLSFVTLASGSSGNAALVSCGQTHILLDAGISARRITTALRGLGVDPASLSGVLITHEHTDTFPALPLSPSSSACRCMPPLPPWMPWP